MKLKRQKRNTLSYISWYRLIHCRSAAKKQSICDEFWAEVLVKMILSHRSAFNFVALVGTVYCNDDNSLFARPSDIFGNFGGQLELLYSHILAQLNIVDEHDYTDSPLRGMAKAPLDRYSQQGRLRILLEHVKLRNKWRDTTLHIACGRGNNTLVKLALQGTLYVSGRPASLDLLFAKGKRTREIPFTIALENRQYGIMETLLKFEIQDATTTSNENSSNPSKISCKARQWSHKVAWSQRTALNPAVMRLDQDKMCRLLQQTFWLINGHTRQIFSIIIFFL